MIRSAARGLIPASIRHSVSRLLGFGMRYSGPYSSWDEALKHTSGYDNQEILSRVIESSRQVLSGEFAYEQDSIGFRDPSPPKQLLHALAQATTETSGQGLNVVDFGGSLGSLFHRARPFIASTPIARWLVCEQTHFVDAGNLYFRRDQLDFAIDPLAAMGDQRVDLLILSSVLPYLKEPLNTLRELLNLGPRWILIDRNPLSPDDNMHLLVQHTPRSIYKATYPIWLLPIASIASVLAETYSLEQTFDIAEGPVHCGSLTGHYSGMLWRRNDDAATQRQS